MTYVDEIECPDCNGNGRIETGEMENGLGGIGFQAFDCPACKGAGWRPMTADELDAAAERQAEDRAGAFHDGGGPLSLDEQHRAAWDQKMELRR